MLVAGDEIGHKGFAHAQIRMAPASPSVWTAAKAEAPPARLNSAGSSACAAVHVQAMSTIVSILNFMIM
jgi:hypothetical protein